MTPAEHYEQLKQEWQAANPSASPAEYEAAMMAIARKVGL